MYLDLKHFIKKTIRPRGQRSFVASQPKKNCKILDIGCGKNSIFLKWENEENGSQRTPFYHPKNEENEGEETSKELTVTEEVKAWSN